MTYKDLVYFCGESLLSELSCLTEKKKDRKTNVVTDKETGISISDGENYIYDKLKEKYGAKDIERQYTDEEKYPYSADFYIPSENMIIEYSKHWTHGRKKYNPDDPQHQKEVEELKKAHNAFSDRAIDTWTRVDPEKEQTAKDAGYKYLVFYNMREFDKWFEDPSLTYEEYADPDPMIYDSDEYFKQKARGENPMGIDA